MNGERMAGLFDPITFRSVTLRNRLGVSPMCMYSSVDGYANDWHLVHLGSRAVGGYGLVMTEATAVEARGRISPEDAGLWEEGQIEPLRRITDFIRKQGAVAGIQLAHAGRKASTARPWGHSKPNKPLSMEEGGWRVVGPSAIAFDRGYQEPVELSEEEIRGMVRKFVDATRRAIAAGFQVIELHGAHGYLFHEFLSPLANARKDAYGGSFDNRIRFLLEVVDAVRRETPEGMPLFVRLSCTDWAEKAGSAVAGNAGAEGSWTLEQSIELSRRLAGRGVDLIDCSSGGMIPHARIKAVPGYQVPFARAIRKEAGIATAAVGLIDEARQAAAVVAEGAADMVFTARQALRDPYFPLHAARELGVEGGVEQPGQYLRS
jgi:2,4-dienoyl-CoA reductase-like NADH-dependent reductase (Old Yellow Enzyme family)